MLTLLYNEQTVLFVPVPSDCDLLLVQRASLGGLKAENAVSKGPEGCLTSLCRGLPPCKSLQSKCENNERAGA